MIAFMPDPSPILVVDDDPKIVALVRTYLERERYPVVTAGDGRTALRLIDEENPRLVVLDLMIPELDGLAVIRARARARRRADPRPLRARRRRATGSSACPRAPTTTCPSRSRRPSSSSACGRSCAGPSAGRRRVPPGTMLVLGDLEVDPARHESRSAARRSCSARSSCGCSRALLEADGRVLTRDQLLDAIHGEGEGDVIDRAIDQYVKRLREKLGDDPAEPRYVATVRGAGYRAAGPVERRRSDR